MASVSTVNALPALVKRVRSVSKLELERLRKTGAYRSLRQEWNNQRNEGKRLKKEREAAEKNWSQTYLNILHQYFWKWMNDKWIFHWWKLWNQMDKIYYDKLSIMHNSWGAISFWLGLGQYPQRSLRGAGKFLLFSRRSCRLRRIRLSTEHRWNLMLIVLQLNQKLPSSTKFTSLWTIFLEWIFKIWTLESSFGSGNSIFLSNLPDLIKAGSKTSGLFVAQITLMSSFGSKLH